LGIEEITIHLDASGAKNLNLNFNIFRIRSNTYIAETILNCLKFLNRNEISVLCFIFNVNI